MAEAASTRKVETEANRAPAKGTRPEGTSNEADASRKVREMFTQIAPSYDALNHLLSLELDRLWRARVARRLRPILERPEAVVLDLCCGTGDLALALRRAGRGNRLPPRCARIVGADFAHAMLVRARLKSQLVPNHSGLPPEPALPVFEADALRLPFRDASFDLVTSAFGFRNLANYEAGLREIRRVLRPGGTIAILEFTEPPDGMLGNLYRWYFRKVLPKIGAMISGNSAAYTYLPKSVARFFRPKELAALMTSVGYESVGFHLWTMGAVALHCGSKK
ncbi:MAG TPA: bifunctional demethylmenaquinone methyltransferase/2-methoxy-6-polyprenyl-1,4-benzoquinol methylase UbiE [Candidatus Solibacter sp.]|nr:bifunctional demethylmenaquinone methyltransferase/2-methoxy-6-polyprenyl-1,4-benzoquinol methylase UbiE [Candidatus Solibacter sp.]